MEFGSYVLQFLRVSISQVRLWTGRALGYGESHGNAAIENCSSEKIREAITVDDRPKVPYATNRKVSVDRLQNLFSVLAQLVVGWRKQHSLEIGLALTRKVTCTLDSLASKYTFLDIKAVQVEYCFIQRPQPVRVYPPLGDTFLRIYNCGKLSRRFLCYRRHSQ